jgi:hypothetical protein
MASAPGFLAKDEGRLAAGRFNLILNVLKRLGKTDIGRKLIAKNCPISYIQNIKQLVSAG